MPGYLKHGSQPRTEFSNFAIVQIDLLVDPHAVSSEVFIIRNVTGLGQFSLTHGNLDICGLSHVCCTFIWGVLSLLPSAQLCSFYLPMADVIERKRTIFHLGEALNTKKESTQKLYVRLRLIYSTSYNTDGAAKLRNRTMQFSQRSPSS